MYRTIGIIHLSLIFCACFSATHENMTNYHSPFKPMEGTGGGNSGDDSVSSGGTFIQTLDIATANFIDASLSISGCTNGDTIYCQVNMFDNTDEIKLATYEPWGTCSGGVLSLMGSDPVMCSTSNTIISAVICTDTTNGTPLIAGVGNTISATCT